VSAHPILAQRRRIAETERLVVGWHELVARRQAEGCDVTVARDMLKSFEQDLAAQKLKFGALLASISRAEAPVGPPQGDALLTPTGSLIVTDEFMRAVSAVACRAQALAARFPNLANPVVDVFRCGRTSRLEP
jgi:hypothetical protein